MARYKVTSPLCLVHVPGNLLYLYQDAPVPSDAPQVEIDRLLAFGMIEQVVEVGDPQPELPVSGPDYSSMDYATLQGLAKDRGIAANLSKEDLVLALSV